MTPFRRLTVFAGLADVLLLGAAVGLYLHFDQASYLTLAIFVAILLASKLIGFGVARVTGREELGVIIYALVYSLIIVLPVFLFSDYWWIGAVISVLLIMLPWLGGQPRLAVPLVILTLVSAGLMLVLDIWLVTSERPALVRNPWLAVMLAVGYVALVLLPGLFDFSRLGEEKTGVFPRLLAWFLGAAALTAALVMGVIFWQTSLLQQEQTGDFSLRLVQMRAERTGILLEGETTALQLLWHSETVVDAINAANANYGFAASSPETLLSLREMNAAWRNATIDSELVRQYLLNTTTGALTRFVNAHPSYLNLALTDRLGGLVAATGDKPELFYYGDEAWWQAAMRDDDGVYLGRLAQDPRSEGYTMLIAVTVKDQSTVGEGADPTTGQVVGLIVTTLDLAPLQRSLQPGFAGFNGQIGLISADGQVLASSDIEAAQTAWDELSTPGLLSSTEIERLYVTSSQGERVMVVHAPVSNPSGRYLPAIQNLGWQVVALQPDSRTLGGLNQIVQMAALAAVLGLALAVVLTWQAAEQVRRPLARLQKTAQAAVDGDLGQRMPPGGLVEWNQLSATLNDMLASLQETLADKDRHMLASEAGLAERTQQIQAAAEVGRSAASILKADELIDEVVGLIRSRFNLYYVGLFLVDESGEWAVLRAGTGEAGRVMQARGHRIRVGQGMIGWSIENQQARVAGEAGTDAVRLATVELPETRAEAALPLTSRGRVIGALTVQSAQEGFFTPSTVTVLQTMADQVAVALDNASLFAESQMALDALRRSYGEVSRKEWVDMMRTRRNPGYASDEHGVRPIREEDASVAVTAQAGGLEVPVRVRDQVLGVLKATKPEGDSEWNEEEVVLLEALADQLSVALENARLYESTQRRAERERVLAEITAKVRASTDINMILQTAIQELADALRVSRGKIELHRAGIGGEDGGDLDD